MYEKVFHIVLDAANHVIKTKKKRYKQVTSFIRKSISASLKKRREGIKKSIKLMLTFVRTR